ncbi:uncharacterized protein LOC123198585 [Mangifera indica]|uniref:uncharacterized protein LOC123198585 n=1 Tax=Mangifera indica TaxID=29780 RepID=UPI001CF98AD1|nr:uncharacterized protein LOC123198585 [Mangifera indica]
MEFENEHNGVPGCVPEFGAIFMSNKATKKECFRRKLLGLPSSQANFVRRVKAGMLLFLFEFERRELHGVFQASSNGAMNIVPDAYCSSGKQFPAQVKFTPLWHCGPLSEYEFRDAIQENYYAAKKFNFGLSEDQVYRLLHLFSLRKLKPQRHLSDTIALANDSGILPAKSSVYNQLKPSSAFPYSIEPQVETLSRSRSSSFAVPYDPDTTGIDTRHSSSHDFVAPGIDARHSPSRDFVAPGIDTKHSSSYDFVAPGIDTRRSSSSDIVAPGIDTRRSSSSDFVAPGIDSKCSSSHGIDSRRSSSRDFVAPSIDTRRSQSQDFIGLGINTRHSSSGDFVGRGIDTRCLSSHDFVGPGMDTRCSSSHNFIDLGIDTRCSSSHDFVGLGIDTRNSSSHDFVGRGIDGRCSSSHDFGGLSIDTRHSSSDDFIPTDIDTGCLSSHDFIAPVIDSRPSSSHDFVAPRDSGLGCCVQVFSSNYYELSRRARMPMLEATYSESMASESGYIDRISEAPIHAFSPSHIPSFVLDDKSHVASREKHDYEMLHCGINESPVTNVPILKESQSQPQNHPCSVKIKSPDFQVNSSSKLDVNKTSGSLYSLYGKKRESVFSRLGVASKARVEENDTLLGDKEDSRDTSINEVMSMLYKSRHKWLKMRKRQLIEDKAANDWKKMQTAVNSPLSKNNFQKISKEVKVTQSSKDDEIQKISKEMKRSDIRVSKENSEQFVEKTSLVDFRRRSEVRKTHNTDTETASCSGNAESECILSGLHKRRKLIRPDFSRNELSDVKSINTETPGVLLPDVVSQMSHEEKKIIEAELDSDCKKVEIGEAAPPGDIDENGKELTQNVNIQSMPPSSVSCEDSSKSINTETPGVLLLDVVSQMSHEEKKIIEAELDSDCKKVEIGEAAPPGDIDENGKELTQNVNIQSMPPSSVSCEDTSKSINTETPGVLLLDVVSQMSHEEKKIIEAELDSDCKKVEIGEAAPPGDIDENGKELTQNVNIQSMPPSSVSCEDTSNIEVGPHIKNSMVDELSENLCNISHCVGQESSHEPFKRDVNGITSGETACCRAAGDEKVDPNPDVDSKIGIDKVTDSSNGNPKSQEHDGCKDGKMGLGQNVEHENDKLQ